MIIDKSKIPLVQRMPITLTKLFLARICYKILKLFFKNDTLRIKRLGIHYEIQLSEGIDLSLFLFGSFQKYIWNSPYFSLNKNPVIIDIGANCGSITLPFAKKFTTGSIIAIEPTHYAFQKLKLNVALNPELAKRITLVQAFITADNPSSSKLVAYGSWKIDQKNPDSHPVHGGLPCPIDATPLITLDQMCSEQNLDQIDLIKIDSDGHEFSILQSGIKSIQKYRPYIIFEIGLYVLEEQGLPFNKFTQLFYPLNYELLNTKNGVCVTEDNYLEQIPLYGTTDLIARPLR